MKKIITFGLVLLFNTISAQVNIDFNTQQLPQTWTMQGSFSISNAAIHPTCQQNSLIGSFFTPSSDFWLQTDTYSYNGNDVNIDVTYGIKDLYNELGVSSPFQKPELFLEYAEGNSNNWIEHDEISLANLNQSATCLTYTTTISASDLTGFQSVKYRFVYKSPAQTGSLYLLYWSIDKLDIEESGQTPCVLPPSPQALSYQTVTQGTALADLNVIGQSLRWYSDTNLTNEIPSTTLVQDMEVYYVTQTINGCESVPVGMTINLVLSTDDFSLFNVKIYPNPVKDILHISSEYEISEIEIFNLLGQKIVNKNINTFETSVDLSMLPQGNYVLKIKSVKNHKILKLRKE